MKFCWFRLYVSEKELNLVFETLPYRINSTDFFIFRHKNSLAYPPSAPLLIGLSCTTILTRLGRKGWHTRGQFFLPKYYLADSQ